VRLSSKHGWYCVLIILIGIPVVYLYQYEDFFAYDWQVVVTTLCAVAVFAAVHGVNLHFSIISLEVLNTALGFIGIIVMILFLIRQYQMAVGSNYFYATQCYDVVMTFCFIWVLNAVICGLLIIHLER